MQQSCHFLHVVVWENSFNLITWLWKKFTFLIFVLVGEKYFNNENFLITVLNLSILIVSTLTYSLCCLVEWILFVSTYMCLPTVWLKNQLVKAPFPQHYTMTLLWQRSAFTVDSGTSLAFHPPTYHTTLHSEHDYLKLNWLHELKTTSSISVVCMVFTWLVFVHVYPPLRCVWWG